MKDHEVLELLKSSPQEGLAAVVGQYSAYVYTIVNSRLGGICPKEDIEEAVSDVFMNFYTAVRRGDAEIRSVCAYLAAAAQRQSVTVFRKKTNREPEISLDELENVIPDEDITAETNCELMEAVHRLGKPDSDIFVRRYYLGQPIAEIARELDMKPNTVAQRISRGLKRLRKMLEEGRK